MPSAFGSERRKTKPKPFRLGGPLFVRIPKALAACILSASALATLGASNLYHPAVAFGPLYMMACAFGAWFVGNRFATCLLAYIVFVEVSIGHTQIEDFHSATDWLNFAIKIVAAIAMILLLGVAREALAIEWKFARIDPLTGALNRKAFFEAVAAHNGDKGEEVLIFADVNNLKRVNDDLGHDAGDAALREFATRIKGAIRKGDLFARLGGDEFVILCKVQNRSAAEVLAKRIDGAVNRDVKHGVIQLTCSVGVLALPAGSVAIDEELRQADKLMYLAKRQNIGAVMAVYLDGKLQCLRPLETNAYSSEQIFEGYKTSKLNAAA